VVTSPPIDQPPDTENVSADGHLMVAALRPWERVGLMVSMCVGVLAVAFEMYAINSTAILIVPDLDGMSRYAWAFTMFALGQVFSIIVVGRLVDRFGAFKPLAAGVALFMIGLTLAGSAHFMFTFLAARAVQGLGGGALNIALMVVVAEVYPGKQRANMMTVFAFCFLLPAFIGPGVAVSIAVHLGWRLVFWLIIPLMAVAAVVGFWPVFQLYRRRVTQAPRADDAPVWAAVAGIVGLAIIQGVSQRLGGEIGSALDWRVITLAIVGVAAVGAAMPRLMPPGFWRFRAGMASLMWVRLTLAGAFFASSSFLTLMLTQDRGIGQERAGWALAFGALGWTLGTLLQSRSWVKMRRDHIIVVGAATTTAAIATMAVFAGWAAVPLGVAIVALVVAGFGMGLGVASTSLALMTLSPPESIGRNTSSLQVADGVGSAFVAGVGGTIMAALPMARGLAITFGWIFAVNAFVALLALLLTLTRLGRVHNEASGVG